MAALTRYPQKIFATAVGAGSQGKTEFGSTAAGSTEYETVDLTAIQSAVWEQGWLDATILDTTKRLPVYTDMNSVHYVFSYQLAYIFQEGIGVWDSATEYRLNSIVKKDGTSQLFRSLQNSNTNHALADGAWWAQCGDLQYIPSAALGTAAYVNTGTGSGNVPLIGTTSATTILAGILEIATDAEASAGTATDKAIVPANLAFCNKNFAKLTYQVSSGTAGGTSVGGSFQTRALNTEVLDPNSIVTLASNQFTLAAGTYKISAAMCMVYSSAAGSPAGATCRIRNITDSTTPAGAIGINCAIFENTSAGAPIWLNVTDFIITIAGSKTFELQYFSPVGQATSGLGEAATSGEDEVYATVTIEKI